MHVTVNDCKANGLTKRSLLEKLKNLEASLGGDPEFCYRCRRRD